MHLLAQGRTFEDPDLVRFATIAVRTRRCGPSANRRDNHPTPAKRTNGTAQKFKSRTTPPLSNHSGATGGHLLAPTMLSLSLYTASQLVKLRRPF